MWIFIESVVLTIDLKIDLNTYSSAVAYQTLIQKYAG